MPLTQRSQNQLHSKPEQKIAFASLATPYVFGIAMHEFRNDSRITIQSNFTLFGDVYECAIFSQNTHNVMVLKVPHTIKLGNKLRSYQLHGYHDHLGLPLRNH